jgi:hypothetical protein
MKQLWHHENDQRHQYRRARQSLFEAGFHLLIQYSPSQASAGPTT